MWDIIKKVLTFNGVSLIIGVIGGVFGIISIFIDWKLLINIKWLVLTCVVSIFIILILVKIIVDSAEKLQSSLSEKINVISIINQGRILLVSNKNTIIRNSMVSVFYLDNDCEIFLCSAYAHHPQDNFTQIKIIKFDSDFISDYAHVIKGITQCSSIIAEKLLVRNIVIYNK